MRASQSSACQRRSVGRDAVRADLLGLGALGHHVLQVRALALELGELGSSW